jgi:hypothetical protein
LLFAKKRKEKNDRSTLSEDPSLPPGWSSFIDPSTGYPCYVNEDTNETQWEHPNPSEVEMSKIENPLRQQQQNQKNQKKDSHNRQETVLPSGWEKQYHEGDKYYQNEDGTTSWDAPEGSYGGSTGGGEESGKESGQGGLLEQNHVRSETALPAGWGKDDDGEGSYYFNDETGETSWTAPEGSTKDGVEHPDLLF